jgi:sugar phosphate isomerase/epimerase
MNCIQPSPWSRRDFFCRLAAYGVTALGCDGAEGVRAKIRIGINTSSFGRQRSSSDATERIARDDIPVVMRDELGLDIIDLESVTFGPRDPGTAERFRARAEAAGCRIINLKVNAHDLPFDSEDRSQREYALAEYRGWIEVAARLGARSLRPYPATQRPQLETLLESYARLADHGERHGIVLLIENYQWIEKDPHIMPEMVRRLGGRVSILVDTGNWADAETRRLGLAAAFPHAITCDFKVRELDATGAHPAYDLRECFDLGHRAGFPGPWCIEHTHSRRRDLVRELRQIKGMLESWA